MPLAPHLESATPAAAAPSVAAPQPAASTAPSESARATAISLALICAVGFAVRLYTLGARSLWMDEGVSAQLARLAWPDFVTISRAREGNMFLYYLFLRVWGLFGDSEVYLRFPSVLLGTLTILALYLLAKELYGRRAGLVAALVLALHQFHVHFSQEARGYALLGLTLTLAAYFLVRALRTGAENQALAFVLFGALSVYAHFFAVLVLAAFLAAAAVFPGSRLSPRHLRNSVALLAIFSYPGMTYAWNHRGVGLIDWIPRPSWDLMVRCAAALGGPGGWLAVALAAWLLLCVAFGLRRREPDAPAARLAALPLLWALLPGLILLLASFNKPLLIDRYLLMSVPGVALLFAYLVARLRAQWQLPAAAALALLLAASLLPSYRSYLADTEDWRGAVGYAVSHAQPDDVVLVDNGIVRPIFEYYRRRFHASAPRLNAFGARNEALTYADFYGITPPDVVARTAQLHDRVWVLEWGAGNRLIPDFERYFRLADVQTFAHLKVRLYQRQPAAPSP